PTPCDRSPRGPCERRAALAASALLAMPGRMRRPSRVPSDREPGSSVGSRERREGVKLEHAAFAWSRGPRRPLEVALGGGDPRAEHGQVGPTHRAKADLDERTHAASERAKAFTKPATSAWTVSFSLAFRATETWASSTVWP